MGYGRVGGFTPPVDWERDGGKLPFPLGARIIESGRTGLHTYIMSVRSGSGGSPCVLCACLHVHIVYA